MAMLNLTRLIKIPFILSTIGFFVLNAQAAELQDLAEIKNTAENYLLAQTAIQFQNQKVTLILGNLDPHLKLPKCTDPLVPQPDIDLSKPNNTLLVSCHGNVSWGVRLSYKLQRFAQVLTPSRTIPKGEKITENDVRLIENDITQLNSYFTDKSSVVGQLAKTIILPGQIIQANQIIPSKFVKRGEMVTMIAEIPGLKITSKGTALNDGTLGEAIQVKAVGSKRIVDATVVSEHTVQVSPQ
jgi:flagella basal body P-ring formation protein FlgA